MNYNPTPKSEFLKDSVSLKRHHEFVENPDFRYSLEVALLEMQRRAASNTDPTNMAFCASSHLRLLGAQDFIDIFMNLGEQMQPGVRTDTTNLPGNVTSLPRKS